MHWSYWHLKVTEASRTGQTHASSLSDAPAPSVSATAQAERASMLPISYLLLVAVYRESLPD